MSPTIPVNLDINELETLRMGLHYLKEQAERAFNNQFIGNKKYEDETKAIKKLTNRIKLYKYVLEKEEEEK